MIDIPYGKTFIEFDETGANVLCSKIGELKAEGDGLSIVKAAMENPIESPRLCELAKGKKNCVIIISDHTRPVPSRDILPNMLAELKAGNPDIDITLLVATGFHRLTSEAELRSKLGDEIYENSKIVIHDCRNPESNVQVGILPSGAPCVIDKLAAEADLLVSEGFIEPHFFAGFSGGRKSVLPGICDQVTVLGNHCSKFIHSTNSRTGKLDGNPMHEDMVAAAQMAKLAFIVNVVIDEDKKTVAAFAGDLVKAHRKGCDFLMDYARVAPKYADIVITSNGGAPLDQNVYQCAKSISAAEATCNPGGVIIECAECIDGHGGQSMYEELRDCKTTRELYDYIMTVPADKTTPDQWETQIFCRILNNYTVIFVTRPELKGMIEDMKMKHANSLDEALAMARAMGKESITVIPNGISVIVAE
ncbi:MAG: nickel-dependent lactate racemase [Oscillospiraceae bacterium]|nr:nickel-dependent lactate racemase [Oscillospiraceae bacterium]